MWSECTGRTRRSGRSVYTGNPPRTVRERYARPVKLSVCSVRGLTFADFLREFTPFIEHYAMSSSRFAILGDFNIHWDKPSDSHVKRLMELIYSLNMIQHVEEPTILMVI